MGRLPGIAGAPRVVPVLVVLVAVLLQVSIVQRIATFSDSPDLVVLAVVSVALLDGSVAGATYGFLGGLALGLATAIPLGPHALVLTLVGYWSGRWGEVLVTDDHPVPPLVAGVLGTLTMQVGRPLVEFLVVPSAHGGGSILGPALLGCALNAMLVVPVYMLVRRIARPRRGAAPPPVVEA